MLTVVLRFVLRAGACHDLGRNSLEQPCNGQLSVCGGSTFTDRPVLWDSLVTAWELSPEERAYVDRQQGTCCCRCGANLRSGVLAEALLGATGARGTLLEFVDTSAAATLEVLEINPAGSLSPVLARLPRHWLANYPDLDMQAMPYPDESFDLVVHSDTLEHVPDPPALSECWRVLRPTGALCFTVPIIVGRLTRSCAGRSPSFHGNPAAESEDLRVQTSLVPCGRGRFERASPPSPTNRVPGCPGGDGLEGSTAACGACYRRRAPRVARGTSGAAGQSILERVRRVPSAVRLFFAVSGFRPEGS